MRKLLFLLSILCSGMLFADNVSQDRAKIQALNFLQTKTQTRGVSPQLQMIWNGEDIHTRSPFAPAYYIFNRTDQPGFVIVSGDDITKPILGYSDKYAFRLENMPENVKYWLKGIRGQINEARAKGFKATTISTRAWQTKGSEVGTPIKEYETAKWNQEEPYNRLCPEIDGYKTVTGCSATAMSIIMRYHKWPDQGEGVIPGYTYTLADKTGRKHTMEGKTLGNPYKWDLMPLTYEETTPEECKDAVAEIMYDCGLAGKSQYNRGKYGGTSMIIQDIFNVLTQYMKYSQDMYITDRSYYPSYKEWNKAMSDNLRNVGPILFTGLTDKGEGHAFILDGFTDQNYFRVNWGWGSLCDGYYLLSALEPEEQGAGGGSMGLGFTKEQFAFLNIKKAESTDKGSDYLILETATDTSGNSYNGLSTETKNIQPNQPFTILAGGIFNLSTTTFDGSIKATLFNVKDKIKEDVCKPEDVQQMKYGSGTILEVTCTITKNIEAGDYIALQYKGNQHNEWKIMYGGKDVVSKLVVKEAEKSLAEETSLKYNKTDKVLVLNTLYNATWELYSDNSKVLGGNTNSDKVVKIDTKSLKAGKYKLVLKKETDQKELTFIVGE